mgnify:CR=1 FL=1
MNQASALASGEWVCFMNAGDMFAGRETVARVMSVAEDRSDLIYGDHEVDYGHTKRHVRAGQPAELWRGMFCSHQALFYRREVLLSHPFRPQFRVVGDYEQLSRLILTSPAVQYVPFTISSIAAGGLSDRKRLHSIAARRRIAIRYWPGIHTMLYYTLLILDAVVRLGLRRLLPLSVVRWMERRKSGRSR